MNIVGNRNASEWLSRCIRGLVVGVNKEYESSNCKKLDITLIIVYSTIVNQRHHEIYLERTRIFYADNDIASTNRVEL